MKRVKEFIKRETVLTAAFLLAALSMVFVSPDRAYGGYVDYQTIALLFCLMAVMAGFQKLGIFSYIGRELLGRVRTGRQAAAVLVGLCFFSSMVITNDVALITFVPFALTVLRMAGLSGLILPVVALQTIAANLGSMLTPIGNPQNLYLYGKSGLGAGAFIRLMLPYCALSLGLLGLSLLFVDNGRVRKERAGQEAEGKICRGKAGMYLVLFAACAAAVARVLPWQAVLTAVILALLVADRSVFLAVDYSLLLTFVGFFIFIGNMGRLPAFKEFLDGILFGREALTAVAASQVISNVPAALLLSGFTDRWESLIVGANLGGLGTLIASMASLISYKSIARHYPERKGRYLALFTAANLVFLAALLAFHRWIQGPGAGA